MGISGPVLYCAYNGVTDFWPDLALGLMAHRVGVATLISGLSFTMIGFLATIITVLFGLSDSHTFRKYKDSGYLSVFSALYVAVLLTLTAATALGVMSFSDLAIRWVFILMLACFASATFGVFMLAWIIYRLALSASGEG